MAHNSSCKVFNDHIVALAFLHKYNPTPTPATPNGARLFPMGIHNAEKVWFSFIIIILEKENYVNRVILLYILRRKCIQIYVSLGNL